MITFLKTIHCFKTRRLAITTVRDDLHQNCFHILHGIPPYVINYKDVQDEMIFLFYLRKRKQSSSQKKRTNIPMATIKNHWFFSFYIMLLLFRLFPILNPILHRILIVVNQQLIVYVPSNEFVHLINWLVW